MEEHSELSSTLAQAGGGSLNKFEVRQHDELRVSGPVAQGAKLALQVFWGRGFKPIN